MKKEIILLFAALSILIMSCDKNKVYEEYHELENLTWSSNEPANFEFAVNDSVNLHNVYINVRHANQYQFSNLWLLINSWSPSGYKSTDTLECILANEQGRWQGSGLGDIWDASILWKQNVRFADSGKYHIELNQLMRVEELVGIMDIGIRVERAEIDE